MRGVSGNEEEETPNLRCFSERLAVRYSGIYTLLSCPVHGHCSAAEYRLVRPHCVDW